MRTVRVLFPFVLRWASIPVFMFLCGWSVVLPFLFAAIGSRDDSLQVVAPFLAGEGSAAYIRALWHLAILLPLAFAACLRLVRLWIADRPILWTVPSFHARYFTAENWLALAVSIFVAALHFRMHGPARALAAFSIALLVFLLMDRVRWRERMALPAHSARIAVLILLLRPSWASALLDWQPLLAALVMLVFVSALYSPTGLRSWARGGVEEALATQEGKAFSSALELASEPKGGEWNSPLWRGSITDWLRAAWYEGWTTRRPRLFYPVLVLFWIILGTFPGSPQMFTAMMGLSMVEVSLRLPARYPLRREQRARLHHLLSFVTLAILLTMVCGGIVLAMPFVALLNGQQVSLFGERGLLVWIAVAIAVAPIIQWPRGRSAASQDNASVEAGLTMSALPPLVVAAVASIILFLLLGLGREPMPVASQLLLAGASALVGQLLYAVLLHRHFSRGDLI